MATAHAISTGAMLGGSGAGFNPQWFYISKHGGQWEPTYAGWGNAAAHGRLMNFRMINAIFASENVNQPYRPYPEHDPAANTAEFISWLPTYHSFGMLACTIGLQGGGIGNSMTAGNASAFNHDGTARLKGGTFTSPGVSSWWFRLQQVIEAMDELGMVCILNIFYFGQDHHLHDDDAVREAVRETGRFLAANEYRNVIVDIANEFGGDQYDHDILWTNSGMVELLGILADEFHGSDWRPPAGTSTGGVFMEPGTPGEEYAFVSDVVFPHGNQSRNVWDTLRGMEWHFYTYGVPVVMNEDDPSNGPYSYGLPVSQARLEYELASMRSCWDAGGSWGCMLFGYNQALPFRWAVGDSADISGGSEENYFRAVLEGMAALTGVASGEQPGEEPVEAYSPYSPVAAATTHPDDDLPEC